MVFKYRKLVLGNYKSFTIAACFTALFLIVCACSSARDVEPVSQLAISPDGNEFVFRYIPEHGDGTLVRFDTTTGAMQTLPQPANEMWWNPTYSSDGKWLAIAVYAVSAQGTVRYSASRIDVMHPNGSERRTVVPVDGRVKALFKFSPDNRRLLFSEATNEDPRPAGFNVREVDLETQALSTIADANFYQLSSVAYFNHQYAYVGDHPMSYLDSLEPAPDKYSPTASVDQKAKWAMNANSMMYVAEARPKKLRPYVSFETGGSGVRPWEQFNEIEGLCVASITNRSFVTMRHDNYPKDRKVPHLIRDVFEMNSNRTFRRLTFFNTVQFYGFDVTPDGRYVAVVPDGSDDPAVGSGAIYRIDSANGEAKVFKPNFSKLSMPR